MKMKEALQAEKVLGTKGLGEVLKRNEYTAITQYYEESKEYHKEIVTLGAAFVYELLNTEEDSDYFILKRLLNILEKLAEIFQIYSAKKIFSIVYEWASESGILGSVEYTEFNNELLEVQKNWMYCKKGIVKFSCFNKKVGLRF